MIERVEEAVKTYPCKDRYRTWPGPNRNTLIAHVAPTVPALRVELPPTAVGKDFPRSGTGFQLSLFGVIGALEEGIEVNLLGLSFGLDFKMPAVKLPGIGRIGWQ